VPLLRKGAISALPDEPVVIPIHMKDGVLLGKGKGNSEWNMSAPHGSGRLYKREDVQNRFSVSAYKKVMQGVYSSSIGRATLDESPFCYRNMADIQKAVTDTVRIDHILTPIYNYKDNTGDKNNVDAD
jgi:RNA-splicing ligase RtcB